MEKTWQIQSLDNLYMNFTIKSQKNGITPYTVSILSTYLVDILRGRIEYELIYSLRGAKHRVDH